MFHTFGIRGCIYLSFITVTQSYCHGFKIMYIMKSAIPNSNMSVLQNALIIALQTYSGYHLQQIKQ